MPHTCDHRYCYRYRVCTRCGEYKRGAEPLYTPHILDSVTGKPVAAIISPDGDGLIPETSGSKAEGKAEASASAFCHKAVEIALDLISITIVILIVSLVLEYGRLLPTAIAVYTAYIIYVAISSIANKLFPPQHLR